jgi:uncharacterized protein DUF4180
MAFTTIEHDGVRMVEATPGERILERPQHASRILEACFSAQSRAAIVYPANLTARFFDLSSGEAGDVLQKIRMFGVRLAIVCAPGDARLSRRFTEILADDLKLFDTVDAARAWLRRSAED